MVASHRIGILGGTFDPVHMGHLSVAAEARQKLNLEEVLFVPAGIPWHKANRIITPVEHRLAMLQIALAAFPEFRLSLVDVLRPGPSFSVDSVDCLRRELGQAEGLFFLVGWDALADLPAWKEPQRLVDMCQVVGLRRPGVPGPDWTRLEQAIPGAREKIFSLDVTEVDVSSTSVQERLRQGLPIDSLVPLGVAEYIRSHSLYVENERDAPRAPLAY